TTTPTRASTRISPCADPSWASRSRCSAAPTAPDRARALPRLARIPTTFLRSSRGAGCTYDERSTSMQPSFTADDLVAHSGFLQRMAAGLLGEPDAARDVAQETLLVALEHPPEPRVEGLRPWLSSVPRNLARIRVRAERHREQREERVGDLHEIAERLEVQRLVCAAVHARRDGRERQRALRGTLSWPRVALPRSRGGLRHRDRSGRDERA